MITGEFINKNAGLELSENNVPEIQIGIEANIHICSVDDIENF